MKTQEYRTLDKAAWGVGPWQQEADKKQWRDEETGLPCLIVRNPHGGNLCGYVGVSKAHSAHGLPYSEWSMDDDYNPKPMSPIQNAINAVEVHGGLTFADGCEHNGDESRGVCHVPGDGEPDDVWWFGFDCAHGWDLSPGRDARYPDWRDPNSRYRDFSYVESECRSLARQLASAAQG